MRKNIFLIVACCLLLLNACSIAEKEKSDEHKAEDLYKAFFHGEECAYYSDGEKVYYADYSFDDNDWNSFRIGGLIDVDNDDVNEQIIDGPMGGFYLDYVEGKLYIFPGLDDYVGEMTYVEKDDVYWIIFMDCTHTGRNYYRIIKKKGTDTETDLSFLNLNDNDCEKFYINNREVLEEEFVKELNLYLAL